MKDSSLSSTEQAVRDATRRASKQSHKRRHHHRSSTQGAAPPRDRSESLTPPRSRPSTSKHTLEHDLPDVGDDFDQSSLPPSQAYKRSRSYDQDDDDEERRFQDKLRSAEQEDQGVGYYEQLLYERELVRNAASFHYGSSVRAAMGQPEAQKGATLIMDEEEYAEYIRAGMWRIQNKEEILRRERLDKAKKAQKEKDRIEREAFQKKEKERIRKLEERTIKKDQQMEKDQREAYAAKWSKITASSTETNLRFSDIPWPIFPHVPFPPLSWPSTTDITPLQVNRFLLSHIKDKDVRKSTLRSAVLAYHPDRFYRLTARIKDEDTRARATELGLRISQTINDMLKK
ncbi:BQ5605_C007g04536 [Microbotryum silenes-dioicae]|uniref:BQ5605_C007g04536 protein n=1 Tax=Microbotryum silenes-dioicae TaxID=796604 RepID=A0A2X0MA89_9BASI|nr:BQ5605_C007g04536 [Microbotryum silenes-dioicae]